MLEVVGRPADADRQDRVPLELLDLRGKSLELSLPSSPAPLVSKRVEPTLQSASLKKSFTLHSSPGSKNPIKWCGTPRISFSVALFVIVSRPR